MGLFDSLKSRRADPSPSAAQSEIPDLNAGTTGAPSASQPSVPGSDLLDSASITSSSAFPGSPEPSGTGRFYNPYEGLNQSLDGRGPRVPYRLPQQPEFLFSEESTVHRRSWSENLTFYTGVGYLTGAAPR